MITYLLHLLVLTACMLSPVPAAMLLSRDIRGGVLSQTIGLVVLWILIEVLVVLGVGTVGTLSVPRVLVVELLLGAGGLIAQRRAESASWWNLLRAQLLALRSGGHPEWLAMLAILALGGGALSVMVALPSGDYDSWMYQLPQVAEWIQHRSLGAYQEQWATTPTFAHLIIFYPGNWTALFWLFTAPMAGDEFTLLPSLVGWTLLGMSSAGLVLAARGSRTSALLAAALAMTIPLAGSNLHSAHVDLGQGSLLLAMIFLSVNALTQGCGRSLLLALALSGMLVGTKMSGLPQLAAPVLVAAMLWARRTPQHGFPALLVAIVALSWAAGLSWYVRNELTSGNPFGYVAVPSLGWTGAVDHAYIARTNLLHCFHVRNPFHWLLVLGALLCSGGGLTVLAVVIIPYRLARRASILEWTLALVAALLAIEYIAGPWSAKPALDDDLSWWLQQQLRYTWTIWGLLAALTAIALEHTRWPALATALITVACAAYAPFAGYGWPAQLAGSLIAAGVGAWALSGRRLIYPGIGHLGVVLAGCCALSILYGCELLRWRVLDHRGYGVPAFLEQSLPADEGIAFWGSHQSWLLYGRHLQRAVHYLYLPSLEPGVAGHDDPDAAPRLWQAMHARGLHYLAMGPKWHEFPATTYAAVERHHELFVLVHGDPAAWGMCIYRLQEPPRS